MQAMSQEADVLLQGKFSIEPVLSGCLERAVCAEFYI
jgi:hypothetical protein